jgi:hypothetical protein
VLLLVVVPALQTIVLGWARRTPSAAAPDIV